jgi:hypothetical protein
MTRQLFLAIALIGTGVFLNPSAEATTLRCEDRAANCVGRCANYTGGAGDLRGQQNKCMLVCNRRVTACLVRANPYPGAGITGLGL